MPTGPAAEALGVHPVTLWRWWKAGRVHPAWITAGGQTRWDVTDLRRQLARLHPTDDEEPEEEGEPDPPPPAPIVIPVIPAFSHTA